MDSGNLLKIDLAQLIKNKNVMANIGVIILALIISLNLHKSQLQKMNFLKESISHENQITGSLGELKALEDEIERLKSNLATDLTSDIVIEKVSSIAGKYNIKINSIDSSQMIDREIYQLLPIRIEFKTDYHNSGHLISDIEKTGIFKVKRFDIRNGGKSASEKSEGSAVSLEIVAVTLKK
jgi:Tfp pilus assembly protein PilO